MLKEADDALSDAEKEDLMKTSTVEFSERGLTVKGFEHYADLILTDIRETRGSFYAKSIHWTIG